MNIQSYEIIAGFAVLVGLLVSLPTILKIVNIRRTPTTWISALPDQGRVEVVGKVGSKTIPSPFKKIPCALWQVEVQEEKKNKGRTYWDTVCKKGSSEPFDLCDDTGTVRVLPVAADLNLNKEDWIRPEELHSEQEKQLEEYGVDLTGFFGFKKRFQVFERRIGPDEELYVNGDVQSSAGSKMISAIEGASLLITDRSEGDLLRGLYWKVGKYMLFAILAGGGLILYLSSK